MVVRKSIKYVILCLFLAFKANSIGTAVITAKSQNIDGSIALTVSFVVNGSFSTQTINMAAGDTAIYGAISQNILTINQQQRNKYISDSLFNNINIGTYFGR